MEAVGHHRDHALRFGVDVDASVAIITSPDLAQAA